MPAHVTATLDKETKNALRFKVEENKYGISGVLYMNKAKFEGKKIPQTLELEVTKGKAQK